MSGQSSESNAGSVCVQPLLAAGIYTRYNCTACSSGACGPPQQCNASGRRLLASICDTDSVECFLTGLQPTTLYE